MMDLVLLMKDYVIVKIWRKSAGKKQSGEAARKIPEPIELYQKRQN